MLERALLFAEHGTIGREQLRFDAIAHPADEPGGAHSRLDDVERQHIERVLAAEGGHVGRAAERLGVPRSTLYRKLKEYGLRPADDS